MSASKTNFYLDVDKSIVYLHQYLLIDRFAPWFCEYLGTIPTTAAMNAIKYKYILHIQQRFYEHFARHNGVFLQTR